MLSRDVTKAMGITFDHFAYATESQVAAKERLYGYEDAVEQWRRLQANRDWPVTSLKDWLPWVGEWSEADLLVKPESRT